MHTLEELDVYNLSQSLVILFGLWKKNGKTFRSLVLVNK